MAYHFTGLSDTYMDHDSECAGGGGLPPTLQPQLERAAGAHRPRV